MKIKINLFLSLIGFFNLLLSILLILNIDFLNIRTILSFFFYSIIPGFLILLSLKITEISFLEKLIYSIGLSISLLIFSGLLINMILPLFNIMEPLSFWPIIISINILLYLLLFIAYIRNKGVILEAVHLKLSFIDKALIIVFCLFPLQSIVSSTVLNNGGPNYLGLLLYIEIIVFVLFKGVITELIFLTVIRGLIFCSS